MLLRKTPSRSGCTLTLGPRPGTVPWPLPFPSSEQEGVTVPLGGSRLKLSTPTERDSHVAVRLRQERLLWEVAQVGELLAACHGPQAAASRAPQGPRPAQDALPGTRPVPADAQRCLQSRLCPPGRRSHGSRPQEVSAVPLLDKDLVWDPDVFLPGAEIGPRAGACPRSPSAQRRGHRAGLCSLQVEATMLTSRQAGSLRPARAPQWITDPSLRQL